jgi:hypothetical protein
VSWTFILLLEQTETPIHLTQSESSHSGPTNDLQRLAAFHKLTTSNMESTSPKKARTEEQPEEGTVQSEYFPLTGEDNFSHGIKRKLYTNDRGEFGGNSSDTGSMIDHSETLQAHSSAQMPAGQVILQTVPVIPTGLQAQTCELIHKVD